MKKKVLISSFMTIAICLCLIAGSTFALFTSTATLNVAVTAGNLAVKATIDSANIKVKSLQDTDFRDSTTFTNGGEVTFDQSTGALAIDRMTPGDAVKFVITVVNTSNVAMKYRLNAISTLANANVKDLTEALNITAHVSAKNNATTWENNYTIQANATANAGDFTTEWFTVPAALNGEEAVMTVTVVVEFPNGTPAHDNAFKAAQAAVTFTVEAVQMDGVDANGELIQGN